MQNDCIFCDVEKREIIKIEQILEKGEGFNVLLALHPATRGHCLVVVKDHYDTLVVIPVGLRDTLFKKAVEVGERLKTALGAKAYTLKVNDQLYKLEAGQGHVGHIHIHVIPRYRSDDNVVGIPSAVSISELQKVKEEILNNDQ